jgi:RNA polymerase sigma-70 factor (ECF subfamily)
MKARTPVPESFDDFAERARPKLLRLVTPMLRSSHEAEDVVQETLLALWMRREEVEDWDAYAARATWLNALKRKARRKDWVELESLEASKVPRLWEDPSVEPWELETAIAELPLTQQTVIRMRFYAGQSFREIGENLEISLNTVASRVRYALEALHGILAREPLPQEELTKPGGSHGKRRKRSKTKSTALGR